MAEALAMEVNRLGVRLEGWVQRHWLLLANTFWGVYSGLPWLAPLFMKLGWTRAARAIYLLYSTQCHQLASRSYFLFGPRSMYTLPELEAAGVAPTARALRAFVGTPEMGYKVAWSDRMVSLYTTLFLAGLLYALLRDRFPQVRISLRTLFLFQIPILLDVGTHMASDLVGGVVGGFRYDHRWLAVGPLSALPESFWVGDALGSLNWLLRLVTGVLAGWALVWAVYPLLDRAIRRGEEVGIGRTMK